MSSVATKIVNMATGQPAADGSNPNHPPDPDTKRVINRIVECSLRLEAIQGELAKVTNIFNADTEEFTKAYNAATGPQQLERDQRIEDARKRFQEAFDKEKDAFDKEKNAIIKEYENDNASEVQKYKDACLPYVDAANKAANPLLVEGEQLKGRIVELQETVVARSGAENFQQVVTENIFGFRNAYAAAAAKAQAAGGPCEDKTIAGDNPE